MEIDGFVHIVKTIFDQCYFFNYLIASLETWISKLAFCARNLNNKYAWRVLGKTVISKVL